MQVKQVALGTIHIILSMEELEIAGADLRRGKASGVKTRPRMFPCNYAKLHPQGALQDRRSLFPPTPSISLHYILSLSTLFYETHCTEVDRGHE